MTALVSHVAGLAHERERAGHRPPPVPGTPPVSGTPILAAGALSTISGVGFAAVAVADDTVHLGMLALYAATGGVFLVIQAGLLACRSHRLPNPPPPCRPEQKCRRGLGIDVG